MGFRRRQDKLALSAVVIESGAVRSKLWSSLTINRVIVSRLQVLQSCRVEA